MKIFDKDYYNDLKTRHPYPSWVPITLAINVWFWFGSAIVIGLLAGFIVTSVIIH